MLADAIEWGGRSRQACPACGRGPRDRALSVTVDERGGVCLCHRCGFVATDRAERAPLRRDEFVAARQAALERERQRQAEAAAAAREMWQAATPATTHPYLA